MNIYPCVKGFFMVYFDSVSNLDDILNYHSCFWGQHALLLSPQVASFNPLTKYFNQLLVCIFLPNLSHHFWCNFGYIDIGISFGHFIMVDNATIMFSHTTYALILTKFHLYSPLIVELVFYRLEISYGANPWIVKTISMQNETNKITSNQRN